MGMSHEPALGAPAMVACSDGAAGEKSESRIGLEVKPAPMPTDTASPRYLRCIASRVRLNVHPNLPFNHFYFDSYVYDYIGRCQCTSVYAIV